jgi:hypothetical protein
MAAEPRPDRKLVRHRGALLAVSRARQPLATEAWHTPPRLRRPREGPEAGS